jgi:hypothetical protein
VLALGRSLFILHGGGECSLVRMAGGQCPLKGGIDHHRCLGELVNH